MVCGSVSVEAGRSLLKLHGKPAAQRVYERGCEAVRGRRDAVSRGCGGGAGAVRGEEGCQRSCATDTKRGM